MQDSQVKITVTAIDGATKVFEGIGDAAVKNANKAANAWIKANNISNVSIQSAGQSATATYQAAKAQDNLANATRRSYLAQTALTTVLSASVNQAFMQMVDVTGQAIQRVDLLANFPKSMEALGLSAADASISLEVLSKYIGEIGGNLQEATTSVARFAEITKNVKAATSIFVGLNNALIAGGAGEQVRASGLEQFTQAFSRGIPQLIEWRSLMVAMPAQLNAVAEALDFKNAQALGESLTNGETSMKDFVTKLTELSTGTGPIAQQALARMSGIQFAFNVLKNTLVEGMTAIIQTIGRQNIIDFFNLLTGTVRQLTVWAVQLISILMSLFNVISGLFGGPQLKLAQDSTAGIADNLGGAADGAGDLAEGLDDASKAAKKTANQLAAFDKMNVLSEPKDDKEGSKAGAPLTASDISGLEDIFGNIDGKIGDISEGSKILAAILASIAGIKFAQGLLNQFNGIAKSIEEATGKVNKFKDSLKKPTPIDASADDAAKSMTNPFIVATNKIPAFFKDLGPKITTALAAAASFIALNIPKLFGPVGIGISLAIGAAFLSFNTLKDNWSSIVEAMGKTWQTFTETLGAILSPAIEEIKNQFGNILKTLEPVLKLFGDLWNGIFVAAQPFVELIIKFYNQYLKPIVDKISEWVRENVKLGDALKIIGTIITVAVLAPLVLLVAGIALVVVAFVSIVNIIVTVVARIIEFFNNVALAAGQLAVNIVKFFFDARNFIVNIWNSIPAFFAFIWDSIVNIFVNVGNFFKDMFQNAWNAIVNAFANVGNFFRGVWNTIVSLFTTIGSAIGNAIGDAFKFVVNSILGFAENTINNFIRSINTAIGLINKIPGVSIKTLTELKIPKLATGTVVSQPTIAMLGEAGQEAVVPLENNTEWIDKIAAKLDKSSSNSQGNPDLIPVTNKKEQQAQTINITVQGVFATSVAEQRKVADLIAKQLSDSLKAKGLKGAF